LARDNFGCGSSREHAPWALADYGFKVIIAPSFADIFYNNAFKNGILLVKLRAEEVEGLFQYVVSGKGRTITADLEKQIISTESGSAYSFEINSFAKICLVKGLDQIGWTLQYADSIKAYEEKTQIVSPWLA
jgi:3-isopropylmalate/(R)-2-methylmalate dehydratase small subunit